MNKQEYVNALRELADFIESKPLPDSWKPYSWMDSMSYPTPTIGFQLHHKEDFGRIAAVLGTFDKESRRDTISAVVTLPTGAKVTAEIAHEKVCERVVVGTKKVAFQQAYFISAVPEHEEEIVEWKCPDSFVALKGETNDSPE